MGRYAGRLVYHEDIAVFIYDAQRAGKGKQGYGLRFGNLYLYPVAASYDVVGFFSFSVDEDEVVFFPYVSL